MVLYPQTETLVYVQAQRIAFCECECEGVSLQEMTTNQACCEQMDTDI